MTKKEALERKKTLRYLYDQTFPDIWPNRYRYNAAYEAVKDRLININEQDIFNRFTHTFEYKKEEYLLDVKDYEIEKTLYNADELMLFMVEDYIYFRKFRTTRNKGLLEKPTKVEPDVPANSTDILKKFGIKTFRCIWDEDDYYFYKSKGEKNFCVILRNEISKIDIENIITKIADFYSFLTSIIISNNGGVLAIRAPDEKMTAAINELNRDLIESYRSGRVFAPFSGQLEVQPIISGKGATVEDCMACVYALDNLRRAVIGLPVKGPYEKKAQMTRDELHSMRDVNSVLELALKSRQKAYDLFNLINKDKGVKFSCKINENINPDSVMGFVREGVGAKFYSNGKEDNKMKELMK